MPNFVSSVSVTNPVSTNDHCAVAVHLNLKIPKEHPCECLIWQYKEGAFPGFREALVFADWESCFDGDVNEVCTKWTSTLFLI